MVRSIFRRISTESPSYFGSQKISRVSSLISSDKIASYFIWTSNPLPNNNISTIHTSNTLPSSIPIYTNLKSLKMDQWWNLKISYNSERLSDHPWRTIYKVNVYMGTSEKYKIFQKNYQQKHLITFISSEYQISNYSFQNKHHLFGHCGSHSIRFPCQLCWCYTFFYLKHRSHRMRWVTSTQ